MPRSSSIRKRAFECDECGCNGEHGSFEIEDIRLRLQRRQLVGIEPAAIAAIELLIEDLER